MSLFLIMLLFIILNEAFSVTTNLPPSKSKSATVDTLLSLIYVSPSIFSSPPLILMRPSTVDTAVLFLMFFMVLFFDKTNLPAPILIKLFLYNSYPSNSVSIKLIVDELATILIRWSLYTLFPV